MSISVKGLQELKNSLGALSHGLKKLDLSAIKAPSLNVVRKYIKRRLGTLGDSYTAIVEKDGYLAIQSDLPYRNVIEYGSVKRNIKGEHVYPKIDPELRNLATNEIENQIDGLIEKNGLS